MAHPCSKGQRETPGSRTHIEQRIIGVQQAADDRQRLRNSSSITGALIVALRILLPERPILRRIKPFRRMPPHTPCPDGSEIEQGIRHNALPSNDHERTRILVSEQNAITRIKPRLILLIGDQ